MSDGYGVKLAKSFLERGLHAIKERFAMQDEAYRKAYALHERIDSQLRGDERFAKFLDVMGLLNRRKGDTFFGAKALNVGRFIDSTLTGGMSVAEFVVDEFDKWANSEKGQQP